MGIETNNRGEFRLKPGMNLQDAVALWEGYDCPRDAIANEVSLPNPGDAEYSAGCCDDTVYFTLTGGILTYEFYGYSGSFADEVNDWIKGAAKDLAAEAWTDEDRSNDGFGETIYGPSERARLEHKIFTRRIMIQDAEREIEEAQAELDELGGLIRCKSSKSFWRTSSL